MNTNTNHSQPHPAASASCAPSYAHHNRGVDGLVNTGTNCEADQAENRGVPHQKVIRRVNCSSSVAGSGCSCGVSVLDVADRHRVFIAVVRTDNERSASDAGFRAREGGLQTKETLSQENVLESPAQTDHGRCVPVCGGDIHAFLPTQVLSSVQDHGTGEPWDYPRRPQFTAAARSFEQTLHRSPRRLKVSQ